MPVTPTSVRLTPSSRAEIEKRGPITEAINESLDRYFSLLSRGRRDLRGLFSDAELLLLCDSCNGTLFQGWSVPLLPANVEDGLVDGIAEKWGVDAQALMEKLNSLPDAQMYALVDAIERYWRAPGSEISTLLD